MENKRFEHIITRYLKGKATPEEEAELLQAIHASKEWEAAFRKRTAEWNPLEETEADPETDRTGNGIGSLRSSRPRNLNRKPKRHRLFLWSQLLPEEYGSR